MAKKNAKFICQECGAIHQKWSGQCSSCKSWDSIVEEVADSQSHFQVSRSKGKVHEFASLEGFSSSFKRSSTRIDELDRVLGGGMVSGAAILLGGDPGIGKSTLILQLLASLSHEDSLKVYVSGEESIDQIRLRAKRLGLEKSGVKLLAATAVADIIASIEAVKEPVSLVVIDSIQTMFIEDIASVPGSVSQVRSASFELINYCKQRNISLMLIGHVTKEGQIAGPRVLEHMVDTVLYFEGERGHQFRIVRAVKNRFGAANEIGVFEMTGQGLKEVNNPSSLFLSSQQEQVSGAAVFAGIEGTRPVLIEIQALVASTPMATPRRAVVGWDSNRLAMILAILQTRYGLFFGDKEVYLNVAGGLKVDEPAADLAVAAALLSSIGQVPLPEKTILFGELGLSGEVRLVSQSDQRIKEAQKLGFEQAICPQGCQNINKDFILRPMRHIKEIKSVFQKHPQVV